MFIPISTDYRRKGTPWVNYGLIAANVIIFLAGFNSLTPRNFLLAYDFILHKPGTGDWAWYQLFTALFLHAGYTHLIFNMLFLWIFGNSLNDRFGTIGYLVFYLAGGVAASAGYFLVGGTGPLLGASGAISAVTGAFMVLMPRTRVTVLVFFFLITIIPVPAILFIGLHIVYQLFMSATARGGDVAYAAHVFGYFFGILVSFGLIFTGIIPRTALDLLYLLRHGYRRSRFNRAAAHGADPFLSRWGGGLRRRTGDTRPEERPVSAEQRQLLEEITGAWRHGDIPAAAQKYLEGRDTADTPRLPRQVTLDIANQLAADGNHLVAAELYESFLKRYHGYARVGEIYLMLGLLYSRYVGQYDKAEQYLQLAEEQLRDSARIAMAEEERASVRRRRHTDRRHTE